MYYQTQMTQTTQAGAGFLINNPYSLPSFAPCLRSLRSLIQTFDILLLIDVSLSG